MNDNLQIYLYIYIYISFSLSLSLSLKYSMKTNYTQKGGFRLKAIQKKTKRSHFKHSKQFSQKGKKQTVSTFYKTHKHGGNNRYMFNLFGGVHKHQLPPGNSEPIHCICVAQIKKKKFFIIVTRNSKKEFTLHARTMPTSMFMGVIQCIPTFFKRLVYKLFKRKKSGGSKTLAATGAAATVAAAATAAAVMNSGTTTTGNQVNQASESTLAVLKDMYNTKFEAVRDNTATSILPKDFDYKVQMVGGKPQIYRIDSANTTSGPTNADIGLYTEADQIQLNDTADVKPISSLKDVVKNTTESGAELNSIKNLDRLAENRGEQMFEATFSDGQKIYYRHEFDSDGVGNHYEIIATQAKFTLPTRLPAGTNIRELHDAGVQVEAYSKLTKPPTAEELNNAGYTARELYEAKRNYDLNQENGAWYSPADLKDGGYSIQEITEATGIPAAELYANVWTMSGPSATDDMQNYQVTKDASGSYVLDQLKANGDADTSRTLKTTFNMSVDTHPVTGAPEVSYTVNAAQSVAPSNVEVNEVTAVTQSNVNAYDNAYTQLNAAPQDSAKQTALDSALLNLKNNDSSHYITRCDFQIPGSGEAYQYQRVGSEHYLIYNDKQYTADSTSTDASNSLLDTHTFTIKGDKEVTIKIDNGFFHTDTTTNGDGAGSIVNVGNTQITVKDQLGSAEQSGHDLYTLEEIEAAGLGQEDDDANQIFVSKILATIGLSSVFSQVIAAFFAICGIAFLLHRHDKKTDSSRYFTYRKILKMLKTPQKVNSFLEKFDDKIYATRFVFEKPLDFCPNRESLERYLRKTGKDDQILLLGYSQADRPVSSGSSRSSRSSRRRRSV